MNQRHADTILVVDDDVFVLDSVSLLLGAYGYNVISSGGASDALATFREHKVDVVLTDIKMPSISGIELLEEVHAVNAETPVILMTAYADLNIAVDSIKKGAFDFIIKPYKPEQLVHSIGKAVKYSRLVKVEREYKYMLEEFNKELETLVAERTMGLMALTVADRVRNPAAAISWTCKRILEKETISAGAREGLMSIREEAVKLETIVRSFQDMLKSRQSMFRYEDVNAIMADIVSVIRQEAENKGVRIITTFAEQPLKMNVQRNLLGVALFHIVRNALEATPEGGDIRIGTFGENERIELVISDTGYGIPAEDIDRIFDPFFSTKQQRFGMGLPLVKQIISEHFGNIQVESSPGTGTTFRITFPVRWAEKALQP